MERLLAVRSDVISRTDTSVAAWSTIVTSSSLKAWFVIRAVVEVLVAEQSAPALLADTVPGSRAGPVHAARVPLALVAQLALPARVAAVKKNLRQLRDNERLIRQKRTMVDVLLACLVHRCEVDTHMHSSGLAQWPCSASQPGRQRAVNKKKTFVSTPALCDKRIINGRGEALIIDEK